MSQSPALIGRWMATAARYHEHGLRQFLTLLFAVVCGVCNVRAEEGGHMLKGLLRSLGWWLRLAVYVLIQIWTATEARDD